MNVIILCICRYATVGEEMYKRGNTNGDGRAMLVLYVCLFALLKKMKTQKKKKPNKNENEKKENLKIINVPDGKSADGGG